MKKILITLSALMLMALPGLAQADSISPDFYEDTLAVGESTTITKTVTITEEVTSAKVDVFFLSDTTGSMFGVINSVKAAAGTILSTTAGLGDVAFGVGEYRDIGDVFTYRLNTDLTTDQPTAQAGINMWAASGGGDFAEANLYALQQVATTTSWRTDSTRILVWFGDAPGHDPSAGGATEISATDALQANNVVVEALNSGSLDAYGQASRIAAATGGHYYPAVDTGSIVTEIQNAITAVFADYSEVSLDVVGNLPGVEVSIAPASYVGDFDRSMERTFTFDVDLTGVVPGDHIFTISALVDGGTVAIEEDVIHVPGTPPVPEPATMLLLGSGVVGLIGLKKKKTSRS